MPPRVARSPRSPGTAARCWGTRSSSTRVTRTRTRLRKGSLQSLPRIVSRGLPQLGVELELDLHRVRHPARPGGIGRGPGAAPPAESVSLATGDGGAHPWWEVYQPVSYNLTSRFGTRAQFAAMVTACHSHQPRPRA